MTKENQNEFIALENIKQQYLQDCSVIFRGFCFSATVSSIFACSKGLAHDKDGFPVPLNAEHQSQLQQIMTARQQDARRLYFERIASANIPSYTENEKQPIEHIE